MEPIQNYDKLEKTLHLINGHFISFSNDLKKRNNYILAMVLTFIIERMKNLDPLFANLFCLIYYGGSYYDGLKVGKPNEYDIDLVLGTKKLRKTLLNIKPSNIPGYVNVELINKSGYEKLCEYGTSNLDTGKVMQWIQSTIQKVFNGLPYNPYSGYDLRSICNGFFYAKFVRQGPALTLKINGEIDYDTVEMDVDLVPCFYCFPNQWPNNFRSNPFPSEGFLIVPKNPSIGQTLHWRLSFQTQEGKILNGQEKVKPAIRLLKKLRDTKDHPIASYYLKTIVLHEIDVVGPFFWADKTLSYTFIYLLKAYMQKLKDGCIKYYWDTRYNLLGNMHPGAPTNLGNQIERMIRDIERNLDNPEVVAKYLLTPTEYNELFIYRTVPESAFQQAEARADESIRNRSCLLL